ncbi:hypothetical protein F511_24891 [Dorcoceras hygrometricum]|uniref:Uncharacterized protein n=1 Tax=Dorcoceras hygrometricum TaxID=472368 RepID=A0A2Z7A3B4_9LAMI|nr:hypothetical protein F511_24891 [Dorcoceras hygrometricum]
MSPSEQSATYDRIQNLTITSESIVYPQIDGGRLQERGLASNLHRSFSARFSLPHSPAQSENGNPKNRSPKGRYNLRKIFDPFVKSKSQRSALSSSSNGSLERTSRDNGGNCNTTISKSPLSDLSEKPHNVEHGPRSKKKEKHKFFPQYSPEHLHGLLRFEYKQGMPFFEFTVKSPDDVYVAKTWKLENSASQVYTFHSLHQRRKSNASGWRYKDYSQESPIIGQMHVSCCYPCQVEKVGGDFSNSMVTEFVLYDVSLLRKHVMPRDNYLVSEGILSWGNCELNEASSTDKNIGQAKSSCEKHPFDSLDSRCLAVGELHPGLEIASIVVQLPFKNTEKVKFKNGDKNLKSEHSGCGIMHVMIPGGSHSLPSSKSRGPSTILDRWRSGGGCDCGGWDMACPLDVFGNRNIHIADGRSFMTQGHVLIQLFDEGRSDSIPRFTMRLIENGKYAVDFHAQLTSLQAFSICLAMLHSSETATTAGNKKSNQMLRADSMRAIPKEETEILKDDGQEENRFRVDQKNMEEILPSLVLDPPFSPIARA